MPAEDVSDLRDVVDAINRLCETMKTSGYEETEYEECTDVTWTEEVVEVESAELVSPEEVSVLQVDTHVAERWPDLSEVYYSACSEVSLVSELEVEAEVWEGRRVGVGGAAAGHVAAMRERFESMTRANTPCPGPLSPAPDLGRRVTPSPSPTHD